MGRAWGVGCLVAVMAVTPLPAVVSAEGVLVPVEASFCNVAYILEDFCTGEGTRIYTPLDLDLFACDYVGVLGNEVGGVELECDGIEAQSFAPLAPACRVDVPNLLLLFNSAGTLTLRWTSLACVDEYDIVRGALAELSAGDLGHVSCVAEDVVAPQKSLPGDPNPAPGETFFYLVRARGGEWGFTHYGYTSDNVQRFPQAGDCAP